MYFEAIHSNRYISLCEWTIASWFLQIAHYTYTYNMIYYLNIFYYPRCFPLQNLCQRKVRNFTVEESLFSAEQNGKIHFYIGYFVYNICGIKPLRVQKPLQWLFINNIFIKIINISLKGLIYYTHVYIPSITLWYLMTTVNTTSLH